MSGKPNVTFINVSINLLKKVMEPSFQRRTFVNRHQHSNYAVKDMNNMCRSKINMTAEL